MSDFILYFKLGLNHVLDFQAYDHILFLLVLAVPYTFKQWKELLKLVTVFTIGHTLTLSLAAYGLLSVNSSLIEFLIPLTIFATALFNIFTAGKNNSHSKIALFLAFCFGWVHGLGFSYYLQILLEDTASKMLPLIEFAFGIEGAQAIIVLAILVIYILLNTIFKVSKRDWILVVSAIVIGVVTPMLAERFEGFINYF